MIKKWFLSLPRAKQITICVFSAHFALLFLWAGGYWISQKPQAHKKVAVRTIQIPKAAPIKKPQSIAKNGSKTNATPKNLSVAPKPLPKKQILKEIASSLKTISQENLTPTTQNFEKNQINISAQQAIKIPKLQVSAPDEEFSENLTEQIAIFLEQMLQLPEFGKVKANLTIDSFGHLTALEIIESASEKNEDFLKKKLPTLLYPCLNKGATLTIVFSNATYTIPKK